MKVETPIGKMRGKLHYYDETPVVVTYHPAYLLRKPSEKAKAWDDLRFALKVIQGRN
jgi:DNA polymerase